jgi:hypothetical protein
MHAKAAIKEKYIHFEGTYLTTAGEANKVDFAYGPYIYNTVRSYSLKKFLKLQCFIVKFVYSKCRAQRFINHKKQA